MFGCTQEYGFPLWIRNKKKKASPLEIQRSLIVSNAWKILKYTNQAAMKKEKPFKTSMKTNIFLHSTATENADDEKKENSIFKSSTHNIRQQRILTYK